MKVQCSEGYHQRLVAFSSKRSVFFATCGASRMAESAALNLNIYFQMLFLDGVYTTTPGGKCRFRRTNAATRQELTKLLDTINHRVGGFLSGKASLSEMLKTAT